MSPVFLREDGFVFKVHSNEEERRHIHVIKAENEAKIWLEPEIEVAWNDEFRSSELKKIIKIITQHANNFRFLYTRHVGKRLDDQR